MKVARSFAPYREFTAREDRPMETVGKGSEVMVFSAGAGVGHIRAGDAMVSAFANRGTRARHVNVLRYTTPMSRRFYAGLYMDLVRRNPNLVALLYNALNRPWQFQKMRLALDRMNFAPLVRLLGRVNPRVAVCTHYLPAEILLHLRGKRTLDMPVGLVVTDFDAHALWLLKGVDWYFVATEEMRVYLSRVGIPRETVHVTGIPIEPSFERERSRRDARLELDLLPDRTTVLVSAGGFGIGPLETLVRELQQVRHPIQVAAVTGRNAEAERRLNALAREARHPMSVVGYTRKMDAWMAASDILVGKPGGLTSAEALASGVIQVIVNPIPGQEERNSDFLLEAGVAVRCNHAELLAHKIDNLLSDEDRLTRMRRNTRRLARPRAATDAVSVILGDAAADAGEPPLREAGGGRW